MDVYSPLLQADAPPRIRPLWHAVAALAFAVLAIGWTFPLTQHLSTHLPGAASGDNVSFLWNFWWMRAALSSHSDVFFTKYLFVPVGTDLTLHTHTALPALVGATIFQSLSITAAQNVTILISVLLNGFCTYLLAHRVTGDFGAALIGGLVFAGSPFIAAHLNGHFNLITAWTIPLFVVCFSRAVSRSGRRPAIAGAVLGLTAYIDYYYVVFECVLGLYIAALAAGQWSLSLRGPRSGSRWLTIAAAILIVIFIALIVTVVLTGGLDGPVGPIRSLRGTFNLWQALWILIGIVIWSYVRPAVHVRRRHSLAVKQAIRSLAITGVVFLLIAAPLAWKAVTLISRGEYVTQTYYWRSAPQGLDIATLALGNPFNPLWGATVQHVYAALGIDAIEANGWLGVAPMLLLVWMIRRHAWPTPSQLSSLHGGNPSCVARNWMWLGVIFFIWALGPHLMTAGHNTGMILPQSLLRFLPIINNARIPGRAMVVVYLALAMVTSLALAERRRASTRPLRMLSLVALLLIVDYVPAPFPMVALEHPAVYDLLRNRPEQGAVCELPLGLRDGFGERGVFDDRVLFYQTIHQRPIVGGFVARLPRSVTTAYREDVLLDALLTLSSGNASGVPPMPERRLASDKLREDGIRFVILDRTKSSPALINYVDEVLPLTLVGEAEGRSLYVVSE